MSACIDNVVADPTSELAIGTGRFAPESSVAIEGLANTLVIADGVSGMLRIRIQGTSCRVDIGPDVRAVGRLNVVVRGKSSHLMIGRGCSFTGSARLILLESSRLVLGEDCMIAGNVDMMTSDAHPIYDEAGLRINEAASIELGDHVWVSEGARILKGARIGSGSVVGLNAVVTAGDYPDKGLLAGVPARVVRRNIRWDRQLPA